MNENLELLASGCFADETLRKCDMQRKIVLNQDITTSILEDVTLRILEWNKEDANIPKESRAPIWLYLQSNGGDVIAGLNLINAIKTSVTPVYTVCFSICASMAFHIFISGHMRFAFKDSILLMHDGTISLWDSSSKVKDTMDFYNKINERLCQHVLTHTKISKKYYETIYTKEYYIFANDAKKLGCVDYIIGEDVDINTIL